MRPFILALFLSAGCGGSIEPEDCTTSDDEDEDGLAGCADPDCWVASADCAEDCAGPGDEDADGLADCFDDDCWVAGGECAEVCVGGEDEDGDGLTDCADEDCWNADARCGEDCDAVGDEDADGLADCEDDECWGQGCTEVCTGGRDEDGDGLLDCEDADCATASNCIEEACDDGLDEDQDGLVDCEDDDCWGNGCEVVATRLTQALAAEVEFRNATGLGLGTCDLSPIIEYHELEASGVVGSARRYNAAGSVTSCDFTIENWQHQRRFVDAGGLPDYPSESSSSQYLATAAFSSGCPFTFAVQDVLPSLNGVRPGAVTANGRAWAAWTDGSNYLDADYNVIQSYSGESAQFPDCRLDISQQIGRGNVELIPGELAAVPTPQAAPQPTR